MKDQNIILQEKHFKMDGKDIDAMYNSIVYNPNFLVNW